MKTVSENSAQNHLRPSQNVRATNTMQTPRSAHPTPSRTTLPRTGIPASRKRSATRNVPPQVPLRRRKLQKKPTITAIHVQGNP